MLIFQSMTIRRAISKNHKALLIGELCHDVSQKYTAAAGEIDVRNWTSPVFFSCCDQINPFYRQNQSQTVLGWLLCRCRQCLTHRKSKVSYCSTGNFKVVDSVYFYFLLTDFTSRGTEVVIVFEISRYRAITTISTDDDSNHN